MDLLFGAEKTGAPPRVEPGPPMIFPLEIKFRTDSAGLKLALRSELLAAEAADPPSRTLRWVYFDTPAGDLRKRKMSLRARKAGATHVLELSSAGPLAEGSSRGASIAAPAPSLDPDIALFGPEIAAELNAAIEGRPLGPKFEAKIKRRARRLDLGRAVVEAAFDEGCVIAGDRRRSLTEVALDLEAGEAAALYDLAIRLAEVLPLRLEPMSLAERGFLLADGVGPAPVRAEPLQFLSGATLDDAVETVIAGTLGQFVANWPAMRESDDPESIHQMRVALRRLRTALAFFNRALPCAEFTAFRAEAGRIASGLGPARDWDAFRDLVETGPFATLERGESFDAFLEAVDGRRASARAAAKEMIDDPATTRFVLEVQAVLARRAWRSAASGAELRLLTESARRFAGATLERLHKRALARGRGLARMAPAERHQVRIALKNLRYAAEFFGVLYAGGAPARSYIRTVATLQDRLGAENDAANAKRLLQEVEAEAGQIGAKAGGVVLGWCVRVGAGANDNLRRSWKSFKRTRSFWR